MLRAVFLVGLLVLLTFLAQLVNSNQCLTMLQEVNPKRVIHVEGQSLNIQFDVSRRVSQRMASRVMRIFLTEVLGYTGVSINENDDVLDVEDAFARLSKPLPVDSSRIFPDAMVNMEVWIPPQEDPTLYQSTYNAKECGSVAPPGHFGWFVPKNLSRIGDTWMVFAKRESAARFSVDDATLERIRNATFDHNAKGYFCSESFCREGMYTPAQCQDPQQPPCALLLTSFVEETEFAKDHVDELGLFVRVAWVGENLKALMDVLSQEYNHLQSQNSLNYGSPKSLVALHWTPSDVIPNERDYASIDFPRCLNEDASDLGCVYESNRLVKVVWPVLETVAKFAYEAVCRAKFSQGMYEDLMKRYNRLSRTTSEDEIACGWLRDNLNYSLANWMPNNADKNTLYIGGIFPMSGSSYIAKSIVLAAKMAKGAINLNNTVLRDYNLTLLARDGKCKSDMVMKSFIDYLVHNYYEKLVGVLGPACSETVEPLVGVSKHYKTVIISYSAEGSSFNDRSRYPYFFRTIGENKQYKHVYLRFMQRMGWHRVAALTEDGQKYTEYISYMQDLLRDNGISFIANLKFPREREVDVMTKYLQDLKQKRAKIIIADVFDQVARQVMCEAYKLQMTSVQGYVWFLPLWLQPKWFDTDHYNLKGEKVDCTTMEMTKAINGHFSISHGYYAPDDDIMQEGITVREWRNRYERLCRAQNQPPSNYAGFAYDAMWTYAYAMDRLIKENESYVFELHTDQTVNRLTDIIGETDFYGVSGRIKFLGGPSRYSVINILQHVDNDTRIIGNFYPNISEAKHEALGGTLDLNVSAIVWLSDRVPDDGSEPPTRCALAGMADALNVSCEAAMVITNILVFSVLGISFTVGFIIVKRRYDEKVRLTKKYMKSLGLELQPDTSGLDKWEIPRDRVVINRKLGEGAFGTVYGGEAFFPEKGWLAVAVKTLKVGSTTDEKLDFLSEVEVMKRFEHKNIIKLLAVCIKCEPVLTVMEFMLYGDLKTYLLARRNLVNDQNYEDSDEISNKKLTAMAVDVARALSYLAQLKYVHRDVASRNCLVNAQRVVKLGDFGMTRPMYENDYYKFNRKGMLPVRWMAPESLGLGIFTPASDVWSYGVLLYEIITFGSFPFQGMSNNQVLAHVKAGNSLTVPKGVKPQLEGLIRSCWNVDHTKRPTAPEIVDFLATNPRLLAPCLDVPLASVQLEHTGQLEMNLPENLRKFAMSLSWPPQKRLSLASALSSLNTPVPPMLDISQDDNQNSSSSRSCDQDSSRPLLGSQESSAASSRCLELQNCSKKIIPRYVNVQPGMTKLSDDPGCSSEMANAIQLDESRPILSNSKELQGVSIL